MEGLTDWLGEGVVAALIGLFGGILLGLAARRGRFCTLGAIEDALYGGDLNRIRMWAVTLATAIIGTFSLSEFGLVDLTASVYLSTVWNPVASVLGGLIFGYGMAIAGNCGYGALARLGGGDLRSFVIVLVTGISAYMILSGPLALARITLFPIEEATGPTASGIAHLIAYGTGIPIIFLALIVSGALFGWAFASPSFRNSTGQIGWATIAGLAVVSGWAGTGLIAANSFEGTGAVSHTFTAPLGETILWMMTASGGGMGFAIGSVAGVVLGAFIGSISKGQFRWEACDDPGELGRQILGGALMGVGGVIALGCSVGQGLTAFSTLAYSAPVVLASIFIGAAIGLRQLIRGFEAVG